MVKLLGGAHFQYNGLGVATVMVVLLFGWGGVKLQDDLGRGCPSTKYVLLFGP